MTGHVFETDFPNEYESWDAVEPIALFAAPVVRVCKSGHVVKLLQAEAKGVDYLVLWLDCDREGENICFEVIDCVKPEMAHGQRSKQTIFRAHFSAITPQDIQLAMKRLGEPNKNESMAVEARQELDLKVGVAFSRFQTRYFQGKYTDLDARCISYGPCQTPTLGFCVQRHLDIMQFCPEPFWTIEIKATQNGTVCTFEWARGRIFDQAVCTSIHATLAGESTLRVDAVEQKEVKKGRPTPMNTVEMLKAASKALGIGPHQAMNAAEHLYLNGYLSYPRTESTAYPKSFDIAATLDQQAAHPTWGNFVTELLAAGFQKPKGGVDMGDHPPITPCRAARPGELHGNEAQMYELVTRHFIASVSPDALFLQTKVSAVVAEEHFELSGKELIEPGWLAVTRSYKPDEHKSFPSFTEGDEVSLCSDQVTLKDGMTQPPGYLTEADLIGIMEQNGIGTDASIPSHIKNICDRNYVTTEAGRTLVPTQLGIVLVQGYHRIDPDLVLPKVPSP